jgi:GNAT superfamily N-acetyltransferase
MALWKDGDLHRRGHHTWLGQADTGGSMVVTHELKVLQAQPDDVPQLVEFINELAESESFPEEVTVSEDDLRANLFGAEPAAEAVIGYLDDDPVSFAVFYQTFATTTGKRGLHIDDLYVRPHAQTRGIGRKMLGYLAQLAHERGCGRMEWWVLDWNDRAARFYQGVGAKHVGHLRIFRLAGDSLEAATQLR